MEDWVSALVRALVRALLNVARQACDFLAQLPKRLFLRLPPIHRQAHSPFAPNFFGKWAKIQTNDGLLQPRLGVSKNALLRSVLRWL